MRRRQNAEPATPAQGAAASNPEHPGRGRLLTKVELADRLQVTTRTIEKQEKLGLPCVRIGASVRYDYPEVLTWLQLKRRGPRDGRGRPRNLGGR